MKRQKLGFSRFNSKLVAAAVESQSSSLMLPKDHSHGVEADEHVICGL